VTATVDRALAGVVEAGGWRPGTTFENRVARRLSRWNHGPDQVAQQHKVGRYRLDFAWLDVKIALEADGWHHRSPYGAARDAERDAYLRSQGWLVFRVDDCGDDVDLQQQLSRVCRVVKALKEDGCRRWKRCLA
jgi:very-short-patch-repair endonuclease